jgi:hypothetical protein
MPRSASTACKVVKKTPTLFPFYALQSTLTSFNDGLHRVLLPLWCFVTKSGYAATNTRIAAFRCSSH